jgi:hypothetical protein
MRDYINVGPVPANEECQQVGTASYDPLKAREECTKFITHIRDVLGNEVGTARLGVKSFPHDFGSYYEVVCFFDDEDEAGINYAYQVESDAPVKW